MSAQRLCLLFLGTLAVISAALGLPTTAMAGVVTGGGVYEPPAGFWSPNTFSLINFDTDTANAAITNGTAITNQYQSMGVVFSLVSPPATAHLEAHSSGALTGNLTWGDDSISPSNTLACWDDNYLVNNGPLWVRIDFLPGAAFPFGLPQKAGLVFTDSPFNDPFTLKAFDVNGILVDSAVSNTADHLFNSTGHAEDTFLGVTSEGGIRHLEYSTQFMHDTTILGNEIDNVYFEFRFAPEPATILLMGLGSAMLIRRRAKQRCGR
jgi:hypothetical protein